jgi:hypothetical protein
LLFADLAMLISDWPVITPCGQVIQYSDDLANVFIEAWQSPRISNHPD